MIVLFKVTVLIFYILMLISVVGDVIMINAGVCSIVLTIKYRHGRLNGSRSRMAWSRVAGSGNADIRPLVKPNSFRHPPSSGGRK